MLALVLLIAGFAAGTLGSLAGVGGGILLVPVMNAMLGIDFRVAVATSLVAVIASSTGSASRYLNQDLVDLRVGMVLEVATVAGAIAGGLLVTRLPVDALRVLFGFIALYLAGTQIWSVRNRGETGQFSVAAPQEIGVRKWIAGSVVSLVAGFTSAVLGIGGGALKVPVMNMVMGLPFRIASATSNYMIGVTAAASALIYFRQGLVDLAVAGPTVLGVLGGATVGSRLMPYVRVSRLRIVFAMVLFTIAIQMFWRGLEIGT